jgi:hypothetical protein
MIANPHIVEAKLLGSDGGPLYPPGGDGSPELWEMNSDFHRRLRSLVKPR